MKVFYTKPDVYNKATDEEIEVEFIQAIPINGTIVGMILEDDSFKFIDMKHLKTRSKNGRVDAPTGGINNSDSGDVGRISSENEAASKSVRRQKSGGNSST